MNDLAALTESTNLSQPARRHLEHIAMQMQLNTSELVPLGIWGDGVPCNFDRSESLEMLTWSLPGMSGAKACMRVPITCWPKKFQMGHHTIDDIMRVVAWSLRACVTGCMPAVDHDGKRLKGFRLKAAGQPFPRSVLVETRADWAWYKGVFRFPQHNELQGICFRCNCKPQDIRQFSSSASWRKDRLDLWKLIGRMLSQGLTLCPLFSAPFLQLDVFAIDWLHCADAGVTVEFLGSLFRHLIQTKKFPGKNQTQRCSELFKDIQAYYKTSPNLPGNLDNLSLSMLGKATEPPKLRARAGEARGLVPYALQVCRQKLDPQSPIEHTILKMAEHLQACYANLSPAAFNADDLQLNCKKFCLLYAALEEMTNDRSKWHIKPKMHMFMELCEQRTCPSLHWNYRDEDAGGGVMQLARRRGGSNSPGATARNMLLRFMAKNRIPVFV